MEKMGYKDGLGLGRNNVSTLWRLVSEWSKIAKEAYASMHLCNCAHSSAVALT